jgi:hypothetical protein
MLCGDLADLLTADIGDLGGSNIGIILSTAVTAAVADGCSAGYTGTDVSAACARILTFGSFSAAYAVDCRKYHTYCDK